MTKKGRVITTPLRLALVMAAICGLLFPGVVTAIGQAAFPYQANGEQAVLNNATIGSYLIGQSTSSPYLFHSRNDSASGVDPDITVAAALSQSYRIHNDTGITLQYLDSLIRSNARYALFFFGTEYVNVLRLNLALVNTFHTSLIEYTKIYVNAEKNR